MAAGLNGALKTRLQSNWSNAVMICSKCSKKVGGGFGPKGKTPLAKALRKHLHLKKGRKGAVGIVEVKCLGVCPGGAVTLVSAADTKDWLLVRPGADLHELAGELGLVEREGAAEAALPEPSFVARMTY